MFQVQIEVKDQTELSEILILVEADSNEEAIKALTSCPESNINIKSYRYLGPVVASLLRTPQHVALPATKPKVKSNPKSKKLLN